MLLRYSRVVIPHLQTRFIMKNGSSGWYRLAVPRKEVEISTVLTCGQSFRWKNDGEDPQEWVGVFGHYLWVLKQTDEELLYKVIGQPELSEEEYNKLPRDTIAGARSD
ncbi:unnamed protein product [Allacma fusca]|uniref:8-oxoguanine DNA glycosylase N-terminal domain-containing protein n=1 Tax=Allacma fusca TaxID=39272 RepID=A0A8J2NRD8_9HEXA|nr:unnamed protein product [Allacma fusca]